MSDGNDGDSEREQLRRARRERAEAADYDTGYAKPPEEHRFIKGHRRRSSARRKSITTRVERLAAIGAEKITVIENGRRRTYSKDEAVDRALFHAAMHSDARARAELLKSWREVDAVRMARQVERDNEPDYRSILMRKIEEMAARSEASKKGNTDDDGGDEK